MSEDVLLEVEAQPTEEQAPVEPEPVKKERPVPVPVKTLGTSGESALVAWVAEGVPHRGYVPIAAVKPDGVSQSALSKAVPYGIAWETLHMPSGAEVAELLAVELRKRDIWTAEDLAKRQQAAIGAIQAAVRLHLSRLNEFSHK